MPALPIEQERVEHPLASAAQARPNPSPTKDGLALERESQREILNKGHRFGIDTPYFAYLLGFGELAPLYGFDLLDPPESAFIFMPKPMRRPPAEGAEGPLYPRHRRYPAHGFYPRNA